MKKVIEGWKHIPGIHCGSTAIRDIAVYHGLDLSEDMCFGLGGGLGFFYLIDSELSPTKNIHLRAPDMEPNFFSLFSGSKKWKFEDNNDKALQTVIEYINRDIPVIIQTDIYFLDYYYSSTHFPGHLVVVCGYDDSTEEVFLSDTSFEGMQKVSYENFKKSRSAKIKPYPLRNNWFEIEEVIADADYKKLIPQALKANAQNMLDGVNSKRGVSSVDRILALAEDILNWKDADDWKWCFRYSYQVIQKRGTCGAGFRWMYRDFLSEAKQFLVIGLGRVLYDKMDVLGGKWYELSTLFKTVSEQDRPHEYLTECSDKLSNIYELERDFYKEILGNI